MADTEYASNGGAPAVRRDFAGEGFRVREVAYRPGLRQAAHDHEYDGITLVLAGGIRETVGRLDEMATCLSVVVKPAGVVHADRVGPRGARVLQIQLDLDRPFARNDRGLGPWRWIHAGAGTRALLALHRYLARAPTVPGLEDRILEVLGGMSGDGVPARRDPPDWLRRTREALNDRSSGSRSVRDLAAQVGVHPVSLTRAFRRHYGIPVTAYRRRVRVRRAARAIERTDRDLTRIAHASGFSDHPHMCREIRETTGLTPGELRRLARRP
jgi:AraC family transcriptional regulator